MKTRKSIDWRWIGIICIAFFLRVFRIGALTEFLGDQGRTMLVMRDFLEGGVVPLVGPSTLSGHNLGPMFYYLLIPGYFGGPVGMSLWMAMFGVMAVVVMYEVSHIMFGVWPARLSSLLWAVSPLIVFADRVIWEPNLVPFFAALYIYLLYIAHRRWSYWIWGALGAVMGVLIQIHYPNVYFAGLTAIYLGGSVLMRMRDMSKVAKAAAWCIFGFLVVLLPFLIFEYTHGFENITGILSILRTGGGVAPGKRVMLGLAFDYSFRVFGKALPYLTHGMAPWLLLLWVLFVLKNPTKKNVFFSLWFFGGVSAMSRYSEVVYNHYLNFLTPVPFLIIASVLASVKNLLWKKSVYIFVLLLCVAQLMQSDVFDRGNNDIARVRTAVTEIKSIAGSDPYSFTLIGSKSYSDLHYRYFMNALSVEPVSFADTKYRKFIVVCDREDCPPVSEITSRVELPILCFEEHCKEFYPKLPIEKEWKYKSDMPIGSGKVALGRLYIFDRR